MAEPIAAWHADHVNFARLLNLLERQLIAFHAGEEPDYPVMPASVYYLRHYPDRVHHPREDVAFARLVARDPALQLPIARRLREHRVIPAAGEELLKLLQGVVEGVLAQLPQFPPFLAGATSRRVDATVSTQSEAAFA